MAKIIKEDSALGATIDEIDLRESLKTKEIDFIKQSLAEYEVIFFRDQDISPEQHKAFALNFGELQSHPVYPTVEGFPEITILENEILVVSLGQPLHSADRHRYVCLEFSQ